MKETILSVQDLYFDYGPRSILKAVNLNVQRGSIYGFLGHNGAGKTTTIRIMLGLLRPKQGASTVLGHSFEPNRGTILSRIGSLIEEPSLYRHLTAYENLDIVRRLYGNIPARRIGDVLETTGLGHAKDMFVRQFSQGMRQRLGLAIALLPKPELLVLDEPTNGLDPAGIRELRELLVNLRGQGITLFISSHLLVEVEKMATHVGIIDHGKMLFEGTLEQLQNQRTGQRMWLEVNNGVLAQAVLAQAGYTLLAQEENRLLLTADREATAAAIRLLIEKQVDVYAAAPDQNLESLFFSLTDSHAK